jgi:hypothetical protein
MTSIVDSAVKIQTTSESNFSPPSRARRNRRDEQVRFARKRFGRDVGDRFSGGARRAMKSSEKARWKSSTSGSNRLPSRSWPWLSVSGSPPVRRCPGF